MVHAEHSAEHHGHHILPFKTLISVFAALIALTVITVLTAQLNLGAMNVPLALAIAITKAALVVMFFMALKYDRPVNMLVFLIGVLFVMVFLIFTWFDTGFRGDVGNVDPLTIRERAYQAEQITGSDPRAASPAGVDTLQQDQNAEADTLEQGDEADADAATAEPATDTP